MLKKFFVIFLCIITSNVVYANSPTANDFMSLCNSNISADTDACNMFFAGYLEGVVNGTTAVEWNLPRDHSLSAVTIKNSFIKLLHDIPLMGDLPVGTVTTVALVRQGALKEKKTIR